MRSSLCGRQSPEIGLQAISWCATPISLITTSVGNRAVHREERPASRGQSIAPGSLGERSGGAVLATKQAIDWYSGGVFGVWGDGLLE